MSATPGPWEAAAVDHGKAHIVKGPPMTVSYMRPAFMREDDAALVAAAPETARQRDMLLEAMRRVAASLNGSGLIADGHPAWPIVRDAIDECEATP